MSYIVKSPHNSLFFFPVFSSLSLFPLFFTSLEHSCRGYVRSEPSWFIVSCSLIMSLLAEATWDESPHDSPSREFNLLRAFHKGYVGYESSWVMLKACHLSSQCLMTCLELGWRPKLLFISVWCLMLVFGDLLRWKLLIVSDGSAISTQGFNDWKKNFQRYNMLYGALGVCHGFATDLNQPRFPEMRCRVDMGPTAESTVMTGGTWGNTFEIVSHVHQTMEELNS